MRKSSFKKEIKWKRDGKYKGEKRTVGYNRQTN